MNKKGIGFVELAIVECLVMTTIFLAMPILKANQKNKTPDTCILGVDCWESGGRGTK
jgi:hypothetical protein